jgi:hypothetical protein
MTALGAADAPQPGGASEDQRLMISQRMWAFAGSPELNGTWVAAGAINDEGTAHATAVVHPHSGGKALVTGTHTLTNSADNGTIELSGHSWLRPYPPPTPNRVMVEGTWMLVSATGAYADVQAYGRLYATVRPGPVVDDRPTREVTIVRDGTARRAS